MFSRQHALCYGLAGLLIGLLTASLAAQSPRLPVDSQFWYSENTPESIHAYLAQRYGITDQQAQFIFPSINTHLQELTRLQQELENAFKQAFAEAGDNEDALASALRSKVDPLHEQLKQTHNRLLIQVEVSLPPEQLEQAIVRVTTPPPAPHVVVPPPGHRLLNSATAAPAKTIVIDRTGRPADSAPDPSVQPRPAIQPASVQPLPAVHDGESRRLRQEEMNRLREEARQRALAADLQSRAMMEGADALASADGMDDPEHADSSDQQEPSDEQHGDGMQSDEQAADQAQQAAEEQARRDEEASQQRAEARRQMQEARLANQQPAAPPAQNQPNVGRAEVRTQVERNATTRRPRGDDDAWSRYVEDFITKNKLDSARANSARSVLREVLARRSQFRASNEGDYARLAGKTLTAEARAEIQERLDKGEDGIFEELVRRLDRLR